MNSTYIAAIVKQIELLLMGIIHVQNAKLLRTMLLSMKDNGLTTYGLSMKRNLSVVETDGCIKRPIHWPYL